MGVRFRLLGPVEVRDDDAVVAVPAGRLLTLLSGLLLRANQVVPVDRLARWLWEGAEPARARATIQEYVRRLRRAIGSEDVIRTAHGGYLIEVDDDSLDLLRFRALIQRGRTAAQAGDPGAAAEHLTAALSLWQGPALANVTSSTLHEDEVANLAEQHLQVREQWADVQLRLGQQQPVIPELRELTREHPLREKPWEQLMIALFRDGRRAEALAAYEQVRTLLAEELGVDPGPSLLATHQAILTGDPSVTSAPSTPSRPAGAPHQLPPDVRGFTGRAADLARLDELLAAHDSPAAILITAIAGTAGVGKSALAAHWARRVAGRFPDGQLWINLHGYDPDQPVAPEQALTMFLRSLGVPGAEIPIEPDAQTALFRSLMEHRRMLVVLDNANSPEQVRPLLPGAPGCLVLITSRADLRGLVARDGAARIRLDLLDRDEAAALLQTLIGEHADPAAVAELVERCARLPLALRIAAELVVAGRSPREVADLLAADSTLDSLGAGDDPRTAIRSVFSWSYRALEPAAARTFRLLGLVPGDDWDAYAAAALADCSHTEAERLLDVLAAAHLVEQTRRGRFHMHDLLRVYATEHAEADEPEAERHAAITRLFDFSLHTAATAMDTAYPHEQHRRPQMSKVDAPAPLLGTPEQALSWLDTERFNLRAAATHAAEAHLPAFAWQLSATLARYLFAGAHHSDAIAIHGLARQAAQTAGSESALATALQNLGRTHVALDKFDEAADHIRRALAIFQQIGDRLGEADSTIELGFVFFQEKADYDAANDHYQRAMTMYTEAGDPSGAAFAMDRQSDIYFRWGRYAEALDLISRALSGYRDIGDRIGEASALDMIGRVNERRGNFTDAIDKYQQALAIYEVAGDRIGEAVVLADLGTVSQRLARYDEALDYTWRAHAIVQETGDLMGQIHTLVNAAQICRLLGRHDEALRHCLDALAIARRLTNHANEIRGLNELGRIRRAAAEPDDALLQHTSALAMARDIGYPIEEARALDGIAAAHHDLGDHHLARERWREALALYANLGAPEADEVRMRLDELPANKRSLLY